MLKVCEELGSSGLKCLGSWGWEGDFGPVVREECDPTATAFLVPPTDATAVVLWHRPG